MTFRYAPFLVLASLALFASCNSASRTRSPLQAPAPGSHNASTSADAIPTPATLAVKIESEPSGAILVVDNVPVGKTPRVLSIPATPKGFCRNPVSLKVRFVASNMNEASHTVEEVLTPLDKIPSAVHFTVKGAARTPR